MHTANSEAGQIVRIHHELQLPSAFITNFFPPLFIILQFQIKIPKKEHYLWNANNWDHNVYGLQS